ncbi:hypothetical protein LJ739_18030 [Aestuariibacter halophilus]|uniref:Uncharacterized protein n=1 Tax=Fluctibacter halophilus TaxID=226011 RepID=A0ABS8GC54_9ALTE|nr:hypothetical protein [Aestuariibacter halophilus]MCC2618160.1 hypothetical protein [Aestuariibacter halophilus]
MGPKKKSALHRRIAAGKKRGENRRVLFEREFVQVRVLAPVKGARKKAISTISLPLEKGAVAEVFEDITLEVGESALGRNIVNVRGNHNQLITSKAIKPVNRSSFGGRFIEPVTVNLSPNLNWCAYCGYVEKGHTCIHQPEE